MHVPKCPVSLSDKGIKLAVTDKEKNFYQISYESGYSCVYSSSKLADKWRPYQIMPDIEFLHANSSRGLGLSPPSPFHPERRKPKKLSFKCEFKNSKIEGVNMCELPLNW